MDGNGNGNGDRIDSNRIDAAQTSADDGLIAELRRVAAEADAVPDQVLAAAQAAITTRDLDGELAALVADSAADGVSEPGSKPAAPAFEPVRAAPAAASGSRLLSFAGGGVQVDLEIIERGDWIDLMGMVTGAVAAECQLEYGSGGQRTLDVDDLGRFLLLNAERGPARVCCRSAGGVRVVTAWVRL